MLVLDSSIAAIHFLRTFRKFKKNLTLDVKIQKHCGYYTCHRRIQTASKNGPWNILFFGNDEFAVESLKILFNKYRSKTLQRLEIVTVNKGKENAVMQYAKQHGIVINTWPLQINISDFHVGIVVSFGHLIPSYIIDSFPLGMINVHASLLPQWRGAAPIIYSLMNGDVETGVTIMKIMPKRFDIGEIVLQKKIDIDPHETLPRLYIKLAKLGADLLGETLENLPQLLQAAKPQSEANVSYAPKITSKISLIKWNEMSAKNVCDLQRALLGLYALSTKFEDKTIKLFDVQQFEKASVAIEWQHETPGAMKFDKENNVLIVKCKGESWISVKKLIISGRAPITARDFYNGFLAGKKRKKAFFS